MPPSRFIAQYLHIVFKLKAILKLFHSSVLKKISTVPGFYKNNVRFLYAVLIAKYFLTIRAIPTEKPETISIRKRRSINPIKGDSVSFY
jgi:hypothetical protein